MTIYVNNSIKSNKENAYDYHPICETSSLFEKETNLEYNTNFRIIQSSEQVNKSFFFLQTNFRFLN